MEWVSSCKKNCDISVSVAMSINSYRSFQIKYLYVGIYVLCMHKNYEKKKYLFRKKDNVKSKQIETITKRESTENFAQSPAI